MKTTREIAEICGVSEQAVRAWCRKNHIAKDAKGSFAISETIEYRIYRHYKGDVAKDAKDIAQSAKADNVVNQAIIDLLRKELEHKNKQIDELSKRLMECQKLLDQEQQLRMVTEQKMLVENKDESNKKWWKFWE
jgi:DNA-binding transcriptional MerR regulator